MEEHKKEVKILVAGSRSLQNYKFFKGVLEAYLCQIGLDYPDITIIIVSGLAKGVDQFAVQYVQENENYFLKEFPSNWKKYGREAGLIRNRQMGFYCDQAIIFWDGKSRGTKHMMNILRELNKDFVLIKF